MRHGPRRPSVRLSCVRPQLRKSRHNGMKEFLHLLLETRRIGGSVAGPIKRGGLRGGQDPALAQGVARG